MKKLIPITSIDQLKAGNTVTNMDCSTIVLAVIDKVVLLSATNKPTMPGYFYTVELLEKNGYQLEVEEVKWKPTYSDKYYFPYLDDERYDYTNWANDSVDLYRYVNGLVCKTSEEAIEMTEKMLKVLKDNQ